MILLLDANLVDKSKFEEGIFHASNNNFDIECVKHNGKDIDNVVFVDVNKGIAIVNCKAIGGSLMIIDERVVSELIYGDFEVHFKDGSVQRKK